MTSFICRACEAMVSRTFVDLKVAPLSNSFVSIEKSHEAEHFYPLHAFVCEECYLVQIDEFEPAENIFSEDYAYYSSFSSSWLKHAETYANEMVKRLNLTDQAHVAEVASNDGYLLQYFVKKGITVTGIDPAGGCAKEAALKNVHTEVEFFNEATAKQISARRGKADLIAANNVLAHVSDFRSFLSGFREMLKPNGVATFEFPHLLELIKHIQFDTIYHEHFSYLALKPVQKILVDQGLRVFDVQTLPTHGGSLRIFACHKDANHKETSAVNELINIEQGHGLTDVGVYDSFSQKVLDVKNSLLTFLIKAKNEGKSIAAYGAPAKGNTLLNYCGIGPEYIDFTVDLNPAKQGKLLPGSRIPIYPVSAIKKHKPDYLFILPWNLKNEIEGQMSGIREWGAQFVIAIPEVTVW